MSTPIKDPKSRLGPRERMPDGQWWIAEVTGSNEKTDLLASFILWSTTSANDAGSTIADHLQDELHAGTDRAVTLADNYGLILSNIVVITSIEPLDQTSVQRLEGINSTGRVELREIQPFVLGDDLIAS